MSSTDYVKKVEPVVDADQPRKCKDCKLDIKPHDAMWTDYCEPCLTRYGSGAGSRHF